MSSLGLALLLANLLLKRWERPPQGLGVGCSGADPDPLSQLISRDGAVLSMGADVQFRVWDPALSVLVVKDLVAATRMTAQSAMAKALGKKSLREIQGEKLRIGEQLLVRMALGVPWVGYGSRLSQQHAELRDLWSPCSSGLPPPLFPSSLSWTSTT